jgi:UDP-4-amino-4,6-dideoxy-N-acetyl-beta-L-altrosamine transaminase
MNEKYIPYGRQDIVDADIRAVTEILRSDWLTQGPCGPRFERALAEKGGARDAVAMCNATAALHVACRALDLGAGDLLWTVPNTFVASANCALYCGADIDFVDTDPRTYNMSVPALEEKLAQASRAGRLPKIVVPVHFGGQSCEMRAIHALGVRYGFRIVEDASHAVGGSYLDKPVGSCEFSDITVFSFHPVKIVTTAEGGAALTNDPALARRLRLLRSHGITREANELQAQDPGGWYYEQTELGYNYRLTDLQSALGLSQLERIDQFVARRREIAAVYDKALASLPLTTPWQHPDARSAFHLYPIHVSGGESRRRVVFDHLRAAGIGVNVHYIPVHLQPYYRARGFRAGAYPNAEAYYAGAISLPMFATLTSEDQSRVIAELTKVLA